MVALRVDSRQRAIALGLPTIKSLLPWVPDRQVLLRGVVAVAAGAAIEIVRRYLTADLPSRRRRLLPLLGRVGRNGNDRHGTDRHLGGEEEIVETVVIRWSRRRRR